MLRFAFSVSVPLAVLFAATGSAAAATTIGADLALMPEAGAGVNSITTVRHFGGGLDNGSPVAGVLTKFRVKTTGSGATGVARVLRQNSFTALVSYNLLNVGPDIAISVPASGDPAGVVTEVATRQPIALGDRLGFQLPGDAGDATKWVNADASAMCGLTGGGHLVGTSLDYDTALCTIYEALIQGTVEPDADGDGYGDETQDACPVENARQAAPCTADVGVFARSARNVGKDGTRKRVRFEVLNNGPSVASDIVLRITKPSFVGSLKASGCTLSPDRRTCTIASLPSRLNTFVVISVRSKRARAKTSKRRNLSLRLVGLSETDPNATNNDALYALKLRMRPR